VLTRPAPKGDFMVEVKFDFDVPPEGCCFNYRQGGVVLYENDDAFLKNAHFSLWDTRQAEWAKEVPPGHPDQARPQRYGNTVLGPPAIPADVSPVPSWLRIARSTRKGQQLYTGYSSIDGKRWVRGGTWTHTLGATRIGLISMGGSGSTVDFDYVRVYRLMPGRRHGTCMRDKTRFGASECSHKKRHRKKGRR
jgi:arabinan endo-1,5-alpha-L-arabinosidase